MERRERWPVAAAAILVAPAVVFVGANLLKYGLGVNVLSEALGPFAEPSDGVVEAIVSGLVLVGPVVGLVLALAPIVRLRLGRSDERLEVSLSVRLRWARIGIALLALAVLFVLGGHILAENLACWFGDATAC